MVVSPPFSIHPSIFEWSRSASTIIASWLPLSGKNRQPSNMPARIRVTTCLLSGPLLT